MNEEIRVNEAKPVLLRPVATIDLGALVANYRHVQAQLDGATAAAMVKANGYGLGAGQVGIALSKAGCRLFFVAGLDEAVRLRAMMADPEIQVLEGIFPGTAQTFLDNNLTPVLNSLDQIDLWRAASKNAERALPASLHIDTGMSRLGVPPDEYQRLLEDRSLLEGVTIEYVMSHLASADITGSPQSAEQLETFGKIRLKLPMGRASLANSAGIYLGPDYHFDLVRPGISLYGGSPFPDSGKSNPMRTVLTVQAPIIQVRSVEPGETVGYGASHLVRTPARIATLPVGYADGFLRSSSNSGKAAIGGTLVPIVGRVSMDLITIDVTGIDETLLYQGAPVELVGESCPVDDVAERAGSIPHEFLTNLSGRFETNYLSQ